MSKLTPALPSFDRWQRAAKKLLTLETALARDKRAVPALEFATHTKLEMATAEARVEANQLFQIAFADVTSTRQAGKRYSH